MLKLPKTWLGVYAGILTAVFAVVVLMGAKAIQTANFDTINVHRINVREPDGTLRMVISNRDSLPGLVIHGKEYTHKRPRAGMLFYNDEGTEQGGLVFSGKKGPDGKVSSGLSLTFDRYDQDQQMQLIGLDQNGRTIAGLRVNDVSEHPILTEYQLREKLEGETLPRARKALMTKIRHKRQLNKITNRYYAGKTWSDNSVVMLKDAQGHPRLMLMVTKEGAASIKFLDAEGHVQRTLTADELATTEQVKP